MRNSYRGSREVRLPRNQPPAPEKLLVRWLDEYDTTGIYFETAVTRQEEPLLELKWAIPAIIVAPCYMLLGMEHDSKGGIADERNPGGV